MSSTRVFKGIRVSFKDRIAFIAQRNRIDEKAARLVGGRDWRRHGGQSDKAMAQRLSE
jgi:hypothetical protein